MAGDGREGGEAQRPGRSAGRGCPPCLAGEQGVDKLARIEIAQVVELFADADETDRDLDLPADIGHDAALGGTVKQLDAVERGCFSNRVNFADEL